MENENKMKLEDIKKITLIKLGIADALIYSAEVFRKDCETRIKNASICELAAIMSEAKQILSQTKEYDAINILDQDGYMTTIYKRMV